MKKINILFLAMMAFFSVSSYGKDNLTGKQIIQKIKDANTAGLGLMINGKIEIQNLKTGYKETRSYLSLTEKIRGLTRSLFRFTDSSYRGTTFLTEETSKGKRVQYLYLPSVGSPRQISSSDKENNFLDTDIANEDLGGLEIDDYTYKRLEDKTINGLNCYVVERYPRNIKSKYKKHLMFIDKQTLLPVFVKSFSKDGRIVKIMRGQKILTVAKNIHILQNMQIVNLKKKHKTSVIIIKAMEKKINPGYFNKNRMNLRWQEEN